VSETREEGLSALLHETRTFPPPEELAKEANAQPGIYAEAEADPLAFWAAQAKQLTWDTPWTDVLEWKLPFAKWFVGGQLNVAYNCLDRHVEAGLGDRVAYYFEGEPGDTRTITYKQLTDMVCQAANTLIELGVKTGDRVAISVRNGTSWVAIDMAALGLGLVLFRVFMRIRPARPDFVIIVQHRPRMRLFLVGHHIDHQPAVLGEFPDIRLGRIGLAQLGLIAEQRIGHRIAPPKEPNALRRFGLQRGVAGPEP